MLDVRAGQLNEELAGLDALELADRSQVSLHRRAWTATWPKLAAVALALTLWQLVVWSGWKPEYVLPGPGKVFGELRNQFAGGKLLLRRILRRVAPDGEVNLLLHALQRKPAKKSGMRWPW